MLKKAVIAVAIAGFAAIICGAGLFIVAAKDIMRVAVPMSSFNPASDSMKLVHFELGKTENRSEFDIPRHYVYFSGENDEYGKGLVVLRLSFRSLMLWDGSVGGAYQKELADFTDKFDVVQVSVQQGASNSIDRFFSGIYQSYGLKKNRDDFYKMSVYDSTRESAGQKFAVYLLPNDRTNYPDTFIEQLSGLDTDRPCTEYTVIDSKIGMDMMFSFQHIADWAILDEKVRQIVEILSHTKPK